jgi:hypothetical protein
LPLPDCRPGGLAVRKAVTALHGCVFPGRRGLDRPGTLRTQPTLLEIAMTWLWTDSLATLLVEHDGVAPGDLLGWLSRPTAYRVSDEQDPLATARSIRAEESRPADVLAAAC